MSKIGKNTLEVMSSAVWYNQWLFNLFERFCRGEILEVGVGIGNFTEMLASKGNVTAIDINKSYSDKISKRFNYVSAGFGDIEKDKYFFKNKKFDTIVCLNVLEHIDKDRRAILNMVKRLNSQGRLIMLVPAHMKLFSEFDRRLKHYRRYSKKGIMEKAKRVKTKVELARYINWWGACGWYFWYKVLKRKAMSKGPVTLFDKIGRLAIGWEKYFKPPFGLSVLVIVKKKI